MPAMPARKPPMPGPSCRIAQFLRLDVAERTAADAARPWERRCGQAMRAGAQGRCCEPGECPNARLMFDLMFDGVDTPDRACMH